MRRRSIKARVTLWYALGLVLICVLVVVTLLSAADRTAQRYCLETLQNAAVLLMDELEYEHGELEIDSDLDDVPNVYASLFAEDGRLIYGRRRVQLDFEDGSLRHVQSEGHSWYVYDVQLVYEQRGNVWLRLYTSADIVGSAYLSVLRGAIWLFPALALLALIGGYWLTARAFRPVQQMTSLAASIADGSDLSRRIGLSGAGDELHALSDTFDAMLERLEGSFERECRFTSDAAHELRTPMNAIAAQCEYGLSRPDAAGKDEALQRIWEKNEEMGALVRQLLMVARVESGQMERSDACALEAMLTAVAEELRPVAEERDMRMETQLSPCEITGNRAMLTRMMVNLTDNAIRYGKENGRVRLGLEQRGDCAILSVADDGCGIPAEQLPHVFERFWRGDAARSTPGTGIGLSIVRSVAEAHGGSAEVESRPGEGTIFRVKLPLG